MSNKLLTLIVDDDPQMRRLVTRTLRRLGFTTRTATSGKVGAQEFMADNNIRLVLSDLEMPRGNGDTLHANIKKDLKERGAFFILMTGTVEGDQTRSYFENGGGRGVPILNKPFTPKELKELLEDHEVLDTDS